jgi:uncharacterized cofD-like protein
VKEAVQNSKAILLFIVNIMTKFGETDNYKAKDFVEKIEEAIGRKIDKVLVNSSVPNNEILDKYKEQKAHFVEMDMGDEWEGGKIIAQDLLDTSGGVVRHNSKKLAYVIKNILVDSR